MSEKPGSLLGGTLLITGSCVGAGMLGLPILTGLAGLGPAFLMFCAAWLFMTLTAFLLIEINSWFPKQVNLLSMVEHTLGKGGKNLCWVVYLFLFYALLVAYISASGSLCSSFFQGIFGLSMPIWGGSLSLVALFGFVVYRGTRSVDLWNRALMVGKIVFFLALVFVGASYVQKELLQRVDFSLALFSLPILLISFGYHNMIPSLTSYMKGDVRKVKLSVLLGSLFAFFLYFLWEVLVLGTVPLEGSQGLIASYLQDKEGAQALAGVISSPTIGVLAQGLAFFAILTSFLAQSLSLVHFLSDGLKISYKKQEHGGLCLLVLCPPLLFSFFYPKLFFSALNFAGGICAILLFGVIPVLAVWRGRYKKHKQGAYRLPGGKSMLFAIVTFGLFVFCFELLVMSGVLSLQGSL
ncbi:MAG: tyrosine transporter [Chlamydiae bacterium]|nr:tyrosine transporter [Chlamydiota bacterium]